MAVCPKCGEEISELRAYSLEEQAYYVSLEKPENTVLDWSSSDPVDDGTVKTDYACPECGETLFTISGNDDSPDSVVEFLKSKPSKEWFSKHLQEEMKGSCEEELLTDEDLELLYKLFLESNKLFYDWFYDEKNRK